MSTFGIILFVVGSIVVFGSDKLYKRGRITDLKSLLIIKSSGLVISIIGVLLMIYGR